MGISYRDRAIESIARELGLPCPPLKTGEVRAIFPPMHSPAFRGRVVDWLTSADRRRRAHERLARMRTRHSGYMGQDDEDIVQAEVTARVYFAASLDLIKIGTTANGVEHRIAEIQRMSAAPIQVLKHVAGGTLYERELHARFAALRSHGEWFRAEEPLLSFIERIP